MDRTVNRATAMRRTINNMGKPMKYLVALFLVIFATGCSSNKAAQDYYLAMQTAAQSNAAQSEARYRALAAVASSGDQQAAIAATMAIALTKHDVVAPQYVESEPLKWAQALATPIAAVAGIAIQADVAKNASDNSTKVQMASFRSNEAIQLGQQQMFTDMTAGYSQAALSSSNALVQLSTNGFDALNTAGDQTAQVGQAGMDAVSDMGTLGIQSVESMANTGIGAIQTTAQAGFDTATDITTVNASTINGLVNNLGGTVICSSDINGSVSCSSP